MRRRFRPVKLLVTGIVLGMLSQIVGVIYWVQTPEPLVLPEPIDYSRQLGEIAQISDDILDRLQKMQPPSPVPEDQRPLEVAKEQLVVSKAILLATQQTRDTTTEHLSRLIIMQDAATSLLNDQKALLQKLVTAVEKIAARPPLVIPPITIPSCSCNRHHSESEASACSREGSVSVVPVPSPKVSESENRVRYPARRTRWCR